MLQPDPATLAFYRENAHAYAEATASADMAAARDEFLRELPPRPTVLDVGCGAGRDLKAFREAGCAALGLEPSPELCAIAAKRSGCHVFTALPTHLPRDWFQFDGLWACASLHHVPARDLPGTLANLADLLTPRGLFYIAMRSRPADEEERDGSGRLFHYVTRASLAAAIVATDRLTVVRQWEAHDAYGRDVTWLRTLARRASQPHHTQPWVVGSRP